MPRFPIITLLSLLALFGPQRASGQFVPPDIPESTDITNCTCDLTANACDINCCCDVECEADDRLAFSYCFNQYTPASAASCVKDSIIFRENTPFVTETTASGLFCVQTDNYEKRNYYNPPAVIEDEAAFNNLIDQYQTFSLASVPFQLNLSKPFYKSGDPVYVIYDAISLGYFNQPVASGTSYCLDTNPVAFMTSKSPTCVRSISTLAADCMTLPTLDASMYYQGFRVVTTMDAFSSVIPDNITMSDLEFIYNSDNYSISITPTDEHICIDENGINSTCPFNGTNLPSPLFTLNDTGSLVGLCSYVVSKVEYTLEYEGTTGIVSASAMFTFRDVPTSSLPLVQEFQTTWLKPGEDLTLRYSGNPGYLLGEPLLAGQLVTDGTGSAIIMSPDRESWFTIPTSTSPDGACGTERRSITFGENQRSGCFFRIAYTDLSPVCDVLDGEAKTLLLGDNPPTHVGSFGNSNTSLVADWNAIIVPVDSGQVATPGPQGQCNNLVTGLDTQIIYALAGDLANPQPRVIGVRQQYIRRTVFFQCFGPYCQPGNEQLTQPVEITASVTYIDASQEAVPRTGPVPKVSTQLPEDFFYPFKF